MPARRRSARQRSVYFMKTFRELRVWQEAHRLVLKTYQMTTTFPSEERFGLASQVRRAAVSVAANIVEGHKRRGPKEFRHFLDIADSSLEEVKYYCVLAGELKYMPAATSQAMLTDAEVVGRMLSRFKAKLREDMANVQ